MSTTKNAVIKIIDSSSTLTRKGSFVSRVCKLVKSGEFDSALSSGELAHLINEGAGKNIRASNLTALMELLLANDVVKIKVMGKGGNKKKYWFPAWVDKKKIEDPEVPVNKTLFLSGVNAWTDPNIKFPDIIEMLKGDLCIVDPFYGNGTFFTLEKFGKKRKIRFLSTQLGNEEQQKITNFQINLKRFKKEFGNIKLKKYSKFYELHDRYIIAENAMVIIGHGIKDFANKESFIVFLPKKEVAAFLPGLKKAFEQRWIKSNDIT